MTGSLPHYCLKCGKELEVNFFYCPECLILISRDFLGMVGDELEKVKVEHHTLEVKAHRRKEILTSVSTSVTPQSDCGIEEIQDGGGEIDNVYRERRTG